MMPDITPGIYEDVPFEEYLQWPAISNSSLKFAAKSMLHYHHRQPIDETPSMRLGTLCHSGRLEPSAIFRRYVVMPDFTVGLTKADGSEFTKPKASAEYKQRVAAWEQTQADCGKLIVTQDEYDAMVEMVASLDRHPVAHAAFAGEGPVEVSIVWDDRETGLRCKGRIDKYSPQTGWLWDLKSTADASRFEQQLATLGYYRQGAFYLDGVAELTGEVLRFGIAAVENVSPYGVRAAPLSESALDAGREEYRELLRQIKHSQKTGHWPGYESPAEWVLPAWVGKRESEQLIIGGEKVTL